MEKDFPIPTIGIWKFVGLFMISVHMFKYWIVTRRPGRSFNKILTIYRNW